MEIILNPSDDNQSLKDYYKKALKEANEILIISAYLTNWDISFVLNQDCSEFSFIIGTDFGITQKQACYKVLKWLPKHFKSDFCAADFTNGFHPKVIIWYKKKKDYYALIGSSNLTQAAFETNYEVNIFATITKREYYRIKDWIYEIKRQSTPVSNDWLDAYKEIKRGTPTKNSSNKRVIKFYLPSGKKINQSIIYRRKQQKSFSEIKIKLKNLINKCSSKKISNKEFFNQLMEIWGNHFSRFQGGGFQIKGKHGNWQEICGSLTHILSRSKYKTITELDIIVKRELDYLAVRNNPNRRAWLTEILCHYYPNYYPLVNMPILTWLHYNKFRSPIKSSEGSKYIDLAVKLRQAIRENKNYSARNLAELDGAIWKWYDINYNV